MPLISFVIPTHNRIGWLPLCLQSLLTQTVKDIEIIVVNDASTDGTEEFLDSWAIKDPRVKVIHNETNKGGGESRNIGCNAASSEIIGVCDDDDVYIETRAEMILDWFKKNPESELVNFPYVSVDYFDEPLEAFEGQPFDHEAFKQDGGVNYWCNPSAAYKKASAIEMGGYSKEKQGLTDDYQFLTNWVKAGKKVDFCKVYDEQPAFSTLHRILPNSMMSSIRGFKPEWVTK